MSDLTETVERIFSDHATDKVRLDAEAGEWPEALWQACIDAGLHLALVDAGEAALGVTVQDAFDIVRRAGAHALPLPLPETMLANWLLARAGSQPLAAPLVVVDGVDRFERVPWGRRARAILVSGDQVRFFSQNATSHGSNIAHEPRDSLQNVSLRDVVGRLDRPVTERQLTAAMAALRTAQIAGAVDWIARATVDYASTRVQFGKPIGKFQAVQHSIAVLASQAAACSSAADLAADAFARGVDVESIAAAKTYASEAAGVVAGLAHQVHGAIGFSREHGLHHRTRRLWSWRDEAGNEAYWARYLGDVLAGQPQDRLWAEITRL